MISKIKTGVTIITGRMAISASPMISKTETIITARITIISVKADISSAMIISGRTASTGRMAAITETITIGPITITITEETIPTACMKKLQTTAYQRAMFPATI